MPSKVLATNASKLYEVLKTGQAPAQGGKAIWQKDIEAVRMLGAGSMAQILGFPEHKSNEGAYVPDSLNFGSRKSTGHLSDETRLRLFHFKQMFHCAEDMAKIETRMHRPSVDAIMATDVFKRHVMPMAKAFDVTDFSNWIPTVNTRWYFEEFELPLIIADLFDEMPMDSATIEAPGALGRLFGRLETDSATFGVQANTQSNFPVTAKNNVVHTEITEDLNQDSAPAIIDKLRREVVAGVLRSEERTLINGDDTGTHMDADVTASTDFRKAYKGLRKRALANSANGSVYDHGGDAGSKALFRALFMKMGKFTSDKADLAWIMGPTLGNDVVTGAIPELFTAYAFGGPASNRTGDMPPIFGVQSYQSEYVREDLDDATGVYVSGGTKATLLLVKKSRFMRFLRAPIRVWAAPSLPSSDKMLMSAKKRHAFAGIPQTADEKSLVIGTNIETDVD